MDEEGREEDKEKEEPIAAGMDEGGGEGKLVKSEEPYERLHCKKCNFVTSTKSKKVRIDGLRRHVKSHHAGKSIIIAEEQTALEDANLVLDYEETDVSTENEIKEGVTDGLNLFLDPKYSDNSKIGERCLLCNFASYATKKVNFSPP